MQPLARAGVVLGMGFGGLFDGIVLHQILGWHHLICVTEHCQPESIEQLKQQNTQDGFFHFVVWFISLFGVRMLYSAGLRQRETWSGKALAGGMLAGWGIFNFVEGVIDHQILGVHHVLPGHPRQLLFDMLFLASGLILAVAGFVMTRRPRGVA